MRLANSAPIRTACMLAACSTVSCSSGPRAADSAPRAAALPGVVQGTATYRERSALPPDAIFEAVLLDISRFDAPGAAMGETVIVNVSEVPISFVIPFDAALIDRERSYAVRTRILADGRPLWVSDRPYRVLTHGAGNSVDVLMRRTGSADYLTAADSVVRLSGEVTYLADVARLTECSSRRIFPVSTEGEFSALLRTYRELASPQGQPLYVTFEGVIANRLRATGTGTAPTVIVRDFIGLWPNQTCAGSIKAPSLLRTSWRITVLDGKRLTAVARPKAPLLELQRDSSGVRYSATVGCNGIGGTATISGDQIDFGTGTGTLMSCGDPLDALEARLRGVLERAAQWEIFGNTLRLMNDAGATVALFEVRK